ncbi:uncharacterized protein LOC129004391 [Macrosteles quadrilineatus]|uniref:uncharacterized protein LOC129004391 n=1 Tax=Macrosteles quadrilineatus TaxID=74068 RepID=UPI0023E16303|nr:uncharacterized protein LOC129004391 [Macrosteles quadrilineatus]
MGPFHHMVVTTMLAFLLREDSVQANKAKLLRGPSDGKPEVLQFDLFEFIQTRTIQRIILEYTGGIRTAIMSQETASGKSAYEARHETYKDFTLAVFVKDKGDWYAHQLAAATDFAKYNVQNGLFFIVHYNDFPARYFDNEFVNPVDELWLDLKDKVLEVTITTKDEYEKRHETYKGREINTIFIRNEKQVGFCLTQEMFEEKMDSIKRDDLSRFVYVVWLTVNVDVLGENYVESICPNRRKPLCYPMMYREVPGKVTEVYNGTPMNNMRGIFNWPCQKK